MLASRHPGETRRPGQRCSGRFAAGDRHRPCARALSRRGTGTSNPRGSLCGPPAGGRRMTDRNGKEQTAPYGPDGPNADLYLAPEISLVDENKTLDQQIKSRDNEALIQQLAGLPMLAYQQRRLGAAQELGIRAPVLDKLVRAARAKAEEVESKLPHWNI